MTRLMNEENLTNRRPMSVISIATANDIGQPPAQIRAATLVGGANRVLIYVVIRSAESAFPVRSKRGNFIS